MEGQRSTLRAGGTLPEPVDVSVIVPCFNQGAYLDEALGSVLAQTAQSWECLVVNDGSTDNTEAIAIKWAEKDSRFVYLKKENGGLSSARNFGLERAFGKYIQFLDSDDLVECRKLEVHANYLLSHPETDIVYGSCRYFDSDAPETLRFTLAGDDIQWVPEFQTCGEEVYSRLIEGNIMPVSAPLIRAELIKLVGPFDLKLGMFADWDFWIRCAVLDATFSYTAETETMTLIRVHPASMTQNIGRYYGERQRIRKKIGTYPLSRKVLLRNKYLFAQEQIGFASTSFKNRAIVKGTGSLISGLVASPSGVWDFLRTNTRRRFERP